MNVLKGFFSVSMDLISIGEVLMYDLYVNSSSIEDKERFVRIFPKGEIFKREYVNEYRGKYHQLYISESQRSEYLGTLCSNSSVPNIKKTEVIKETAIKHLDSLFALDKDFSTDVLQDVIEGCRDTVVHLVDVVSDYSVKDLQAMIGDLSFHDFYTYDHSINVSMYCISIFRTIKPNASKKELLEIGLGGLLHDMGKILISTNILNSPGKLTDKQFTLIKQHPALGEKIFNEHPVQIEGVDFSKVRAIITQHHENVDGTGYPHKLKGEEINYFARVAAIADFFDAITTKRSYSKVLSVDEALSLMDKSSGKKIDPALFEKFVKNVQKLVMKGDLSMQLDESFDPSIQYDELPLRKIIPKKRSLNE